MTGVYGKLPSHGDFLRRGLPQGFVLPWDQWLQAGMQAAEQTMGAGLAASWVAAPVWRFHLPAAACGPAEVVGVLLTSADAVGRRFPLTLAAALPAEGLRPPDGWFDALERAGRAARDHHRPIDELMAALPEARPAGVTRAPGHPGSLGGPAGPGWWTGDGSVLPLRVLPTALQFVALLRGPQAASTGPTAQAVTHTGTVRSRNEDAFVDRSDIGLWAVADGAGGHGAGDVASAAVADALSALPPGLSAAEVLAQVRLRLTDVHLDLQEQSAASAGGLIPATTVVVLMVRGDHFACLWAGDSRAYLLRDGALRQLTEDHSLVQELVKAELVRPEDAEQHQHANIITRAVGGPEPLQLDKVAGRLMPGDRLLLCSDGLFKALPETAIAAVLRDGGGAQALIDQALQAGARDNVTAVVVGV